jgi:hypothetical protein
MFFQFFYPEKIYAIHHLKLGFLPMKINRLGSAALNEPGTAISPGKFMFIHFPPFRPPRKSTSVGRPRNPTGSKEIIPPGFSPKVIGMNKSRAQGPRLNPSQLPR